MLTLCSGGRVSTPSFALHAKNSTESIAAISATLAASITNFLLFLCLFLTAATLVPPEASAQNPHSAMPPPEASSPEALSHSSRQTSHSRMLSSSRSATSERSPSPCDAATLSPSVCGHSSSERSAETERSDGSAESSERTASPPSQSGAHSEQGATPTCSVSSAATRCSAHSVGSTPDPCLFLLMIHPLFPFVNVALTSTRCAKTLKTRLIHTRITHTSQFRHISRLVHIILRRNPKVKRYLHALKNFNV